MLRRGPFGCGSDALGSVTRITDTTGTTAGTTRYLAFGSYREQSGSQDRYAFVSRENHLAGSLYYMRARYYDPTIGRFLSADPAAVRAGYNFYAYVGNNPANLVDSSGLGIYFNGGGGGGGGGSAPWDVVAADAIIATAGWLPFFSCAAVVIAFAWEISRPERGGPWLNSKFAHCWAGCAGERACGISGGGFVWSFLWWKEVRDIFGPEGFDQGDVLANTLGWAIGKGSTSCVTGCESYYGSRYEYRS